MGTYFSTPVRDTTVTGTVKYDNLFMIRCNLEDVSSISAIAETRGCKLVSQTPISETEMLLLCSGYSPSLIGELPNGADIQHLAKVSKQA
jgi:hypothetical protein